VGYDVALQGNRLPTFPDNAVVVSSTVKGKAIPLQAWTGPEGSRSLRLPDLKRIGNEGRKVFSPRHRPPLPPGNILGTHFC